MRTAIILLVDAKGVPKVAAHGPYDETKRGAASAIAKLKNGESAWIVASGFVPKIFKGPKEALKKASALIAVCLLCLSASAQQDITALLTTSQLLASTTNTACGNGVIGWNIDQVAVLQASIISTNGVTAAATNTITLTFDTSANRTDWVADAYTFTLVSNGTNAVTDIQRITNSIGGKWLRFGTYKNPNTNYITLSRFTFTTQ